MRIEGHKKNGDVEIHNKQTLNITPGLSVYLGLVILIQSIQGNTALEPQNIECEILYQASDLNYFQPVQMKKMSLNL